MKVKINYFFFVLTIFAPLLGAIMALPYGLFIASTPYYFSWPFGSFWQEFFAITIVMIFLFSLLIAYMALPWLAVIREDGVTFHRLFRRKLIIEYSSIKGAEVISKKLPVKDYRWGIGSISFKMKDGDEWLVSGIGHVIILEICRRLKEYEVNCFEVNRKLTDDEKRNLQKRGF